jgi:RNA polymerase sigma-70 factor (ECF subfamily)
VSAKNRTAEDRELVTAASRGDVEAFAKLVRDNSSLVYRVALRMLGTDDAQDASQEVWVRVWRNITNFRGESALSTWLYRITVNTCLSIRQKQSRREERELGEEVPYLAEPSGGDADPEAAALNAERREEIHDALQHVRAEHRAALILRHMEGLSYAEIAEVLDIPDGTAKGWVSRGRAAMLVVLAEKDGLRRTEEEEEEEEEAGG